MLPSQRQTTWWWFLIPLFTFGFGTWIMVLVGAATLRSRGQKLAGIGYLALTILLCVGISVDVVLLNALAPGIWLLAWLGGTGHVTYLQIRVRDSAPPISGPPPIADPALLAARARMQRRIEARAILRNDRVLAAELRIGRPDLPRQWEDGGLVDINHVPAATLTTELELPPPVAATVVAVRDRLGGFSGPEELIVYCDAVTPDRLALIRDRLVFVPL